MKRLSYYWDILRGYLMIRFCPRRWRSGVLAMTAAWSDFDGLAGPAVLLECTAKQLMPSDVGEILVIIKCDCGRHLGTSRVNNDATDHWDHCGRVN